MSLLLADASPLIAFCEGGEHQLLMRVVSAAFGGRIFVPHHVDGEILRKVKATGRANYRSMIGAGTVYVYTEATLSGPYFDVFMSAIDLLDVSPAALHDKIKDGGEAFAVAHAQKLKKDGHSPVILMDDRGGRIWAQQGQIEICRTLQIFHLAKDLGLVQSFEEMDTSFRAVKGHTVALTDSDLSSLLVGLPRTSGRA